MFLAEAEVFTGMMTSKPELRRSVLAARRALDPGVRIEADTAIAAFAADLAGATVAAYAPAGDEPGGATLADVLAATGATVLLPVLRADLDLDWAEYHGALAPTARGPREPVGPRLGVGAIAEAALVLVPALAVDRSGMRLGRGGGSYDRALTRATGLVVALLYPGELVDVLPAESHDQPVHAAYDGAHLYWTGAGRMTHHWHSNHRSASDGG